MQQFTVPQFIDVENKIIGPVTTRQFVIMLGAFILSAVYYKLFDFSLFLTAGIVTLVIAGVFAFAKINGRPFHFFILNVVQTFKRPKLRIWDNSDKDKDEFEQFKEKTEVKQSVPTKHYTRSRLAELSLIVDTGGAYQGEKNEEDIKISGLQI